MDQLLYSSPLSPPNVPYVPFKNFTTNTNNGTTPGLKYLHMYTVLIGYYVKFISIKTHRVIIKLRYIYAIFIPYLFLKQKL